MKKTIKWDAVHRATATGAMISLVILYAVVAFWFAKIILEK